MAETIATPSAPQSIACPAFSRPIPPIATIAWREISRTCARPPPQWRSGIGLRGSGKHRPDAEIVDIERRGCPSLLDCFDRQTDDGVGPQEPSRTLGFHVLLSDVHAIGSDLERDVHPVVDDQWHLVRGEELLQLARKLNKVPLPQFFSRNWTAVTPPRTAASTTHAIGRPRARLRSVTRYNLQSARGFMTPVP